MSVLLEASSRMMRAESEQNLFAHALEVASHLLDADGCQVWRRSRGRGLWRVVATRGLTESDPGTLELHDDSLPHTILMIEDAAGDKRLAFLKSFIGREGIHSALVVPWLSDPSSLDASIDGAMIYYWRSPHQAGAEELAYAWALANSCSSALHRLELNEDSRREKQRLEFLAEASVMMASSLDYELTLKSIAQLAVSRIAEWCTVHVAEEGKLTRLVVAHADPQMKGYAEEYERRYPEKIDPQQGVGKVFATGEKEIVPFISEEMLKAAALDEDHLQLLLQLKLSSSIVVPIRSREKVLGAIRLLGTNGRYFGDSDVQLATALGQRAAVAIENAQLHHALLERDNELRQSHAAAKMGSWSWDLENDRLFWSAEFRALHGLPEDAEATAQAGYDLVHPDDRERSRREFWATLESSASVFNSEHRSLTPDGRVLWLQVRGRIRRDATGKATWIAGLIIDVTESRIAEQALRRAEKLAAAGRFAATVAHEVNNPLEALMNTIYLAKHTKGLPPEAGAHLRVADAELQRISHIVRQTLGFYRESALPQSTGLVQLAREVLDLYHSRSLSRGLTLRIAPHSHEEVFVTVIAGEMKQVLANLIANAMDATPAGGVVEVSVTRRTDGVEIAVSDTGCGISEADRRRLFEPFFTTKADIGTGLGLWVSKGIVEKHGGVLLIDEAGEQGTTFRVRL